MALSTILGTTPKGSLSNLPSYVVQRPVKGSLDALGASDRGNVFTASFRILRCVGCGLHSVSSSVSTCAQESSKQLATHLIHGCSICSIVITSSLEHVQVHDACQSLNGTGQGIGSGEIGWEQGARLIQQVSSISDQKP